MSRTRTRKSHRTALRPLNASTHVLFLVMPPKTFVFASIPAARAQSLSDVENPSERRSPRWSDPESLQAFSRPSCIQEAFPPKTVTKPTFSSRMSLHGVLLVPARARSLALDLGIT